MKILCLSLIDNILLFLKVLTVLMAVTVVYQNHKRTDLSSTEKFLRISGWLVACVYIIKDIFTT